MRVLLVALSLVVGLVGSAEARRGGGGLVVINTGDTIIHLKDLPKEQTLDTSELADRPAYERAHVFGKLGYRHERFGLFWFDLWRWGGEFVVYDGDTYIPIPDDVATELGASVPWRYHLPDGLLIVIAAGYLLLIGRRRRRAKTALSIAGAMLVVAIAFFVMGLTWELAIPLAIAAHHGLAARAAMRAGDEASAEASDETSDEASDERGEAAAVAGPRAVPEPSRPRAVPAAPMRAAAGTPPPLATRPSSQPVVVIAGPPGGSAPAVVPMRPDDSVDGPKLLR